MRKLQTLAVGVMLYWATGATAIQPPRVIELTDGSIPFRAVEWSPDGKRLAALSRDGVYIIEAKEGAQPQKINDLQLDIIKWLSDSLLVGGRDENVPGHRFRRISKLFVFDGKGNLKTGPEGFTGGWPIVTVSGTVLYDSSGMQIGFKTGNRLAVVDRSQEFVLVNHYPQRWTTKGPTYQDTDLWLESIDSSSKTHLTKGETVIQAHISGDGTLIAAEVATYSGGCILVMTLVGEVISRLCSEQSDPDADRYSGIMNPDLSADNALLIFVRGWEGGELQSILEEDVYAYDLRSGQEVRVTNSPTLNKDELRFNRRTRMATCLAEGHVVLIVFGE